MAGDKWTDHKLFIIECPNMTKRIDFAMGEMSDLGITSGQGVSVNPELKGPSVKPSDWNVAASLKIDCKTAQQILRCAEKDKKTPPDYNFFQDCHWYTRKLFSIGSDTGYHERGQR